MLPSAVSIRGAVSPIILEMASRMPVASPLNPDGISTLSNDFVIRNTQCKTCLLDGIRNHFQGLLSGSDNQRKHHDGKRCTSCQGRKAVGNIFHHPEIGNQSQDNGGYSLENIHHISDNTSVSFRFLIIQEIYQLVIQWVWL